MRCSASSLPDTDLPTFDTPNKRIFTFATSKNASYKCIIPHSVRIQKIKEHFPNCKIVAVDIVGSQIFEQSERKKHISGIGTGFIPHNLTYAKYDDYMIVEESEAISECNDLLVKGIVAGASSGAVAYAIQNYTGYSNDLETKTIVGIFSDRGEIFRYNI